MSSPKTPSFDGPLRHSDTNLDFRALATVASEFVAHRLKFQRRYYASATTDIGSVTNYSNALVHPLTGQNIDPALIKQLGPSGAKWVLVPVVEGYSEYYAVLVAGEQAQLSLYLLNRETGELWWKGTGTGGLGTFGLIPSMINEFVDKRMLSLRGASHSACDSLPKRKNSMNRGGGDWLVYQDKIRGAPDLAKISVTLPIDGCPHTPQDKPLNREAYRDEIVKRLALKGYQSIPLSDYGLPTAPTKEQVVFADTEFGKALACIGTRYVLIPIVDAAQIRYQETKDVSMYLFDTSTGEMVWEGSGANGGGFENAIITVLREGFPKRAELSK